MSLTLIGTGVGFDLTLSGLEALEKCDEVFIETYTNPIPELETQIRNLEAKIKKQVVKLDRMHLESDYLVNKAESSKVCILISGDPLTATTHITLVMGAKQKGVLVNVIHNSSIYSVAPARSGLQIYRFGKTASLVNPRPKYKPTSSLVIIKENLSRDLHTLVLLDTEPEPMMAKTALNMLSEAGFNMAVLLSRIGSADEKITFGKTSKLNEMKEESLGKPPFTVIIPAKLHPLEQEFLDSLNSFKK